MFYSKRKNLILTAECFGFPSFLFRKNRARRLQVLELDNFSLLWLLVLFLHDNSFLLSSWQQNIRLAILRAGWWRCNLEEEEAQKALLLQHSNILFWRFRADGSLNEFPFESACNSRTGPRANWTSFKLCSCSSCFYGAIRMSTPLPFQPTDWCVWS